MHNSPALLERIVEPVADVLTPDAARRVLAWTIDDATQQRLDYLADRCNDGRLTADEAAEYDRYLSAFDVLAILQAKARTVLDHVVAE